MGSMVGGKVLEGIRNKLLRYNPAFKSLSGTCNTLRKDADRRVGTIKRSKAYEAAGEKRDELLENDSILKEARERLKKAEKDLEEAFMNDPLYREAIEAQKARKMLFYFEDELVGLSIRTGEIQSIYKPNPGKMVADAGTWLAFAVKKQKDASNKHTGGDVQ